MVQLKFEKLSASQNYARAVRFLSFNIQIVKKTLWRLIRQIKRLTERSLILFKRFNWKRSKRKNFQRKPSHDFQENYSQNREWEIRLRHKETTWLNDAGVLASCWRKKRSKTYDPVYVPGK